MARAKSKEELISNSENNYKNLNTFIENIPSEFLPVEFNFSDYEKKKEAHWNRDKDLKDVYIHLYEWHQLVINWVNDNSKGIDKSFLPEGYNWRTYGEMNKEFVIKHKDTSENEAKELFYNSHKEIMALVNQFNNEELFTKGYYSYVGNVALASYFISSTSSHYDWALKKLKAYVKTKKI